MQNQSSCHKTCTRAQLNSPHNRGHKPAATVVLSSFDKPEVIFVEPFYGGSHKQLVDLLRKSIPNSHFVTLPAKKWHWRARCSALILSGLIPRITSERILFCSSVLSLAELVGLRPDLVPLKKIVYFHENQLVYPVRKIKERDVQFAYNQITSCLAANVVVFNSHFNKNSFLDNLKTVIKLLPDFQPKLLRSKIESKVKVLYYPLEFPQLAPRTLSKVLRIAWPHRWEFDKDLDTFIDALVALKDENLTFKVVILGEQFAEVPDAIAKAKKLLESEIAHVGYVENKEEYFKLLQSCHVVVSTAQHEFYGVSMLEATYCGCFPLVPNRLVYPEFYSSQCMYKDVPDLVNKLQTYCQNPFLAVKHRDQLKMDFDKFNSERILPHYLELFGGSLICHND